MSEQPAGPMPDAESDTPFGVNGIGNPIRTRECAERQQPVENDALGAARFQDFKIERLARAIHDAAHENARCNYRCEFWHTLCAGLRAVTPDDLRRSGITFDTRTIPSGGSDA